MTAGHPAGTGGWWSDRLAGAAVPSADARLSPHQHSAAYRLLRALAAHGIEFFFANAGTDFPSIIEAFAQAAEDDAGVPRPLLVPHENAAVAMAHGVYMVSGRPQAVMVHTAPGTANALNPLINASRDGVPLLLLAGRSPLAEAPMTGARTRNIHWAQEMFDQAGMLREFVKWDYELRYPDQVEAAVGRAWERAMSSPRGPVYLTLPREILAAGAMPAEPAAPRAEVEAPHPSPAAIAALAAWIMAAQRPLIIAGGVGRTAAETAALSRLAERFALPVVAANPRFMCLPSDHAMHHGFQPRLLLERADLVLVLDCDVPWVPALEAPPKHCRVAHLGEDPGFARYPMRSFPSDLSIPAEMAAALRALSDALDAQGAADDPKVVQRRRHLSEASAELRAGWAAARAQDGKAGDITAGWISHCLAEAVGKDAIIVNEYPLRLEHCPRANPGTYFGLSAAGGLGWSLGAALGAKLADPSRLVAAVMGDGAYIFANPVACHWAAAAHDLPLLTIIMNNGCYGAVRNTTLAMYPKGAAARHGGRLLAELAPSPSYELLVQASGGYGARISELRELPAALARAVDVVRRERRQAVVNVICRY